MLMSKITGQVECVTCIMLHLLCKSSKNVDALGGCLFNGLVRKLAKDKLGKESQEPLPTGHIL
jgi:hypothetical protein